MKQLFVMAFFHPSRKNGAMEEIHGIDPANPTRYTFPGLLIDSDEPGLQH